MAIPHGTGISIEHMDILHGHSGHPQETKYTRYLMDTHLTSFDMKTMIWISTECPLLFSYRND